MKRALYLSDLVLSVDCLRLARPTATHELNMLPSPDYSCRTVRSNSSCAKAVPAKQDKRVTNIQSRLQVNLAQTLVSCSRTFNPPISADKRKHRARMYSNILSTGTHHHGR